MGHGAHCMCTYFFFCAIYWIVLSVSSVSSCKWHFYKCENTERVFFSVNALCWAYMNFIWFYKFKFIGTFKMSQCLIISMSNEVRQCIFTKFVCVNSRHFVISAFVWGFLKIISQHHTSFVTCCIYLYIGAHCMCTFMSVFAIYHIDISVLNVLSCTWYFYESENTERVFFFIECTFLSLFEFDSISLSAHLKSLLNH